MTTAEAEAVRAPYGQRMIEIKVRFFTDGIADAEGHVRPKHAWNVGVVRIKSNAAHGIKQTRVRHFHSLDEIPAKIEEELAAHGVVLHQRKEEG